MLSSASSLKPHRTHTSSAGDAKIARASTDGGDGLAAVGAMAGGALPGGAPGGGRRLPGSPGGETFAPAVTRGGDRAGEVWGV